MLDQDAPPSLRLLVLAARHDRGGPAGRILAACADTRGLESRLVCGAGGLEPPPGIRIFQPFADGAFLAEAEPGFDATDHSQHDADLLRRLADWLADWPPDLVHLHDLAPFGMEFIGLIRRVVPTARILLSLTPELAGRLGITGPPRGFLHAAPLRRFLAEATLLLPCASLIPPALEFGLDPARLLVHAPLWRALAESPPPPLGRFLVVACFPQNEMERGLLAATAALLAHSPEVRLLEMEGDPTLASAHLLLLPDAGGADTEGLAMSALALRRPVICAAQGPLASQIQAGRDGWHCPMNATALAHLLLDLAAAPDQVAVMAKAVLPPPSPAEAAVALVALYRDMAADPARIAPPMRV